MIAKMRKKTHILQRTAGCKIEQMSQRVEQKKLKRLARRKKKTLINPESPQPTNRISSKKANGRDRRNYQRDHTIKFPEPKNMIL